MKVVWAMVAIAVVASAADLPGMKPRLDVSTYPSHGTAVSAMIGARLLTPEQVRSQFSTELDRGYVVVEVAVYPKAGTRLDLGPGDFALRIAGSNTSTGLAAPRTIAAILQRTTAQDRDISVYPTVGVGYETGDSAYGGRRGGWSTGAGVGVGVGGRRPASTAADRKTMELELGDQQLPERIVTAPVAGYLYFPLSYRKKDETYLLEYQGGAGNLELPLALR